MRLWDKLESVDNWHIWLVLALAAFFSFWHLGAQGLYEWDESRYGEIAYWMCENGDFINYSYANQLDSWNAKPPLSVWLITLSYQLLGYSEWALRLPSALAIIGFFIVFFQFISFYQSRSFALVSCLVLMACKGLIGHHVGRTGDTDALLVLFLMGFLYAMVLYIDGGKPWAILLASISLGLAFYTKGPTFVFYLPGVGLYLLFRKRISSLLLDYRAWCGLLLLIACIYSWYVLVNAYGKPFEQTTHMGRNSWEVMVYYDTFHRFTSPGVEGNPAATSDYGFFFSALDVKFNLWNYLLYAGLALGLFRFWRKRESLSAFLNKKHAQLLLLSGLLLLTQAMILTISQSKLVWYIAPLLPFAAVWVVWLMQEAIAWRSWLQYVFLGLWLFTMGRQFLYIHNQEQRPSAFLREHKQAIESADQVWIYKAFQQDVRLYADWYNRQVDYLINWKQLDTLLQPNQMLIAVLTNEEREQLENHASLTFASQQGLYLIWKKEKN